MTTPYMGEEDYSMKKVFAIGAAIAAVLAVISAAVTAIIYFRENGVVGSYKK